METCPLQRDPCKVFAKGTCQTKASLSLQFSATYVTNVKELPDRLAVHGASGRQPPRRPHGIFRISGSPASWESCKAHLPLGSATAVPMQGLLKWDVPSKGIPKPTILGDLRNGRKSTFCNFHRRYIDIMVEELPDRLVVHGAPGQQRLHQADCKCSNRTPKLYMCTLRVGCRILKETESSAPVPVIVDRTWGSILVPNKNWAMVGSQEGSFTTLCAQRNAERVLIPAHTNGNHWVLAVLNVRLKQVVVYDSSEDDTSCRANLNEFYKKKAENMRANNRGDRETDGALYDPKDIHCLWNHRANLNDFYKKMADLTVLDLRLKQVVVYDSMETCPLQRDLDEPQFLAVVTPAIAQMAYEEMRELRVDGRLLRFATFVEDDTAYHKVNITLAEPSDDASEFRRDSREEGGDPPALLRASRQKWSPVPIAAIKAVDTIGCWLRSRKITENYIVIYCIVCFRGDCAGQKVGFPRCQHGYEDGNLIPRNHVFREDGLRQLGGKHRGPAQMHQPGTSAPWKRDGPMQGLLKWDVPSKGIPKPLMSKWARDRVVALMRSVWPMNVNVACLNASFIENGFIEVEAALRATPQKPESYSPVTTMAICLGPPIGVRNHNPEPPTQDTGLPRSREIRALPALVQTVVPTEANIRSIVV
uniref:ULP_PROTEASE domain-containing protein n=2 Tax=Steinernema glaseri TaxID=37863 RepID=A0A1I7Y6C0_9BILA